MAAAGRQLRSGTHAEMMHRAEGILGEKSAMLESLGLPGELEAVDPHPGGNVAAKIAERVKNYKGGPGTMRGTQALDRAIGGEPETQKAVELATGMRALGDIKPRGDQGRVIANRRGFSWYMVPGEAAMSRTAGLRNVQPGKGGARTAVAADAGGEAVRRKRRNLIGLEGPR